MHRKIIFLLLIVQCSIYMVHAQTYDQFSVKEEYDYYNASLIARYKPFDSITRLNDEVYGDGMSHILDSYITMYETTSDKAYLYKFVMQSLSIVKNRHDFRGVDDGIPRWDNSSSSMYLTGNTLAPLAHFVYFIKSNQSLDTTCIYPFAAIQNNSFNTTFHTFGAYASWLQERCGESLWWFISNGYWTSKGFRRLGESSPAEINQQVGFGRALLYIGLAANDASLMEKAAIIANQFKSTVSIKDKCLGGDYTQPVLKITANNAYKWYHAGWRVKNYPCNTTSRNYKEYTKYEEDISHGVHVTWLVNDFLKYQPKTPFKEIDMVRLKNTFAKNIYGGNGIFHNTVSGADFPFYCGEECNSTGMTPNFTNYKFVPLSYMYLVDFENIETTSPTVYEIVMEDYRLKILGEISVPNLYGGQANKGHAEVVAAQWKRESFNLTLYKRNVVYSQDFYAKNKLTIAPLIGPDTSYAEPTESQEFKVEENVVSNISAEEEIILKPGIHFTSGSHVTLSITPIEK